MVMDSDLFHAYTAGFWDGEGWLVIGLERKEGRTDVHRISVYITQRAQHREVLDRIQAEFGGKVTVRDTKIRASENWAEQADWHIHKRDQIERFCLAVRPYSIVKAPQIEIALEFVQGFSKSPVLRDGLGRVHGMSVSLEEVERRERLRLALKEANARGPVRTVKIERPPMRVQRIDHTATPFRGNASTVSRGESRYNATLTEEAVREIRAAHANGGITMEVLADRYGVSPAAIRQVIRRISWRHVT
jgi:hypothetical protein